MSGISRPGISRPYLPVGLAAGLSAVLLVWDPPVRDLAAHVFRAELFEREGFAIWNASWYGGHYLLTHSVLFPPLGALLGAELVGAVSVVVGVYLFDRLAREHWGDRVRPATLWYAAGAVTMLASGRISFAIGVALALASLRALQLGRAWPASAAAGACALASPVAAVFLAGVVGGAALGERSAKTGGALALAAAALIPVVVLNLMFPDAGREPFAFSAWIALPLWCAGALYVLRGLRDERALRAVIGAYLVVGTLVWLIPNPMGGNATRLGALFGGPVLAAVLLSRRVSIRGPLVVVLLAGSVWWQFQGSVRDVAESIGDRSTSSSYYRPLEDWLRVHGGHDTRIEVPFTFNHWETTYLAPEFALARGWLRQLDRERNDLFYEGRLTHGRYRDWLEREGVRYVALADADSDYSAEDERRLISSAPSYLRLRSRLPHWQVYEVEPVRPLVEAVGGGRARLRELSATSFELAVREPGSFTVRVRATPYWVLSGGRGCVGRDGAWTLVRADQPGSIRVSTGFSIARAALATTRDHERC